MRNKGCVFVFSVLAVSDKSNLSAFWICFSPDSVDHD